jgi:Stigma-specific protein, Stig1
VCSGGTTACAGQCVDTQSDGLNCGSCGNACAAGKSCVNGACTLVCTGGLTKCAGACVDTSSDPSNCGSCGNVCSAPLVCQGGSCTLVCGSGLTNCQNQCVNLQSDANNCGSCGNVCNSSQACTGGSCVAVCDPTQNLATSAAATSSGGGTSTLGPDNMNDGYGEAQCSAQGWHWITANTSSGTSWAQLAWTSAKTIGRIKMDTAACAVAGCGIIAGRTVAGGTIQWWNGTSWVSAGTVSAKSDDWQFVFPSPVSTTKVRIYGLYAQSCGMALNPVVYEIQAFGC